MENMDLKSIIPIKINSPALITLSVCFYAGKTDFSGCFKKISIGSSIQEFRRGLEISEVCSFDDPKILEAEYEHIHKLKLNAVRILRSAQGLGFITFSFNYTNSIGEFIDVLKDVGVGVYNLRTEHASKLLKPVLERIFSCLNGERLWIFPPFTGSSKIVSYNDSSKEQCYDWIDAISKSEGLFHICYSINDTDFDISKMDTELESAENFKGPKDHAVTYGDAFNRIVAETSLNSSKAYRDDMVLLQGDLMSFYSPLGCGIYRKNVQQKAELWIDVFKASLAGIEAVAAILYDLRIFSGTENDARTEMGYGGPNRKFKAILYKRSLKDSMALTRKKDEIPLLLQSNDRINRLYAHYLQALDFGTMVDTVNARFDRCQLDYDNSKKDSMELVSILIGIFAILSAFKDGSDFTNTIVNNIVHFFNAESQFNLESSFWWYVFLGVACILSLWLSIHLIRKNRHSSEVDKIKDDDLKSIL